jgi:copper chaperone CopZ
LTELELLVAGIHCDACAGKITQALAQIPGVRLRPKVAQKHVYVRYVQQRDLRGALEAAGFRAVEA